MTNKSNIIRNILTTTALVVALATTNVYAGEEYHEARHRLNDRINNWLEDANNHFGVRGWQEEDQSDRSDHSEMKVFFVDPQGTASNASEHHAAASVSSDSQGTAPGASEDHTATSAPTEYPSSAPSEHRTSTTTVSSAPSEYHTANSVASEYHTVSSAPSEDHTATSAPTEYPSSAPSEHRTSTTTVSSAPSEYHTANSVASEYHTVSSAPSEDHTATSAPTEYPSSAPSEHRTSTTTVSSAPSEYHTANSVASEYHTVSSAPSEYHTVSSAPSEYHTAASEINSDLANQTGVSLPGNNLTSQSKDIIANTNRNYNSYFHNVPQVLNNLQDSTNYAIQTKMDNSTTTAIAAGDELEEARYGVWGSPFYIHMTQKSTKDQNSYNAQSIGGTIGFDTKVNDTMTIGIAGTYAQTNVKHKDNLSGDKDKINSYLVSVYGTQVINNDYFITGIANFSTSKVKSDFAMPIVASNLKASYDIMSFGGELIGGYNYKATDNVNIIPTIGVSYNQVSGYNLATKDNALKGKISVKQSHGLNAIAGIKVISTHEVNDMIFTPEIHAKARYNVIGKAPSSSLKLDGMATAIEQTVAKNSKFSGTVGASLTASKGMVDCSLGYDLTVGKKVLAHNVGVKLKLKF